MPRPEKPLYYGSYLQLERLLDCQHLESAKAGPPAHDEMLFIIIHQTYELWFKQILWELDAVLDLFAQDRVREEDVGRATSHLHRIVEIQRVLISQVTILETMTPLDFLEFRDALVPASGFQSVQFRLVENKLGIDPKARLKINRTAYTSRLSPPDQARLKASEEAPSLFVLVERWLKRTPFLQFGDFDFWNAYRAAVDTMLDKEYVLITQNPSLSDLERAAQLRMHTSTRTSFEALFDGEKYAALVASGDRRLGHQALQAALLINLYRDKPILQLPFRFLVQLMDIDENFTTWRHRHALMALRMIGTKIGTGGSAGHAYLRDAAEQHKVFGDLLGLSTFFIPRSALPELPEHVTRAMDFSLNRPD